MPSSVPRLFRFAAHLAALGLLSSGCLTYERSQTRVSFDRETGLARIQVTYRNLATTETGPDAQWEDFAQLDSLRRSEAYFKTAFLREPGADVQTKRRVWMEGGQMHASYTITTSDLNALAEGWTADSTGYRYTTIFEVTKTNGAQERDGDNTTVLWRRPNRLLLVAERDPHFREAVPFLSEIRDSVVRLDRRARRTGKDH